MSTSGFPCFHDGNVEIRLAQTDEKYVLHAHVLSLHSSFFKASLSEKWEKASNTQGPSKYWTYELRFEKDCDIGVLERTDRASETTECLSSSKRIYKPHPDASAQLNARRLSQLEGYRALLRTIYHLRVDFGLQEEESFARMVSLNQIARAVGSEEVVKLHIDYKAFELRPFVLLGCVFDSAGYIKIGYELRSAWIFEEAASRIIGADTMTFNGARKGLVELGIEEVFDKKRTEFVEKLRKVDITLMCEQTSMESNGRTTSSNPGAKLASMVYHEWISEELAKNQGSLLGKGYAAIYFDIAHPETRGTYSRLGELAAQIESRKSVLDSLQRVFTDLLSRSQATVRSILGVLPNRPRARFGGSEDLPYGSFRYDELPWNK